MAKNRLSRLGLVVLLLASLLLLWACGPKVTQQPVQLLVIAENPEHQASESELWGVFAKANPGVTIKCESFEDTGYEAFAAKVNAGNAPMIVARDFPEMITNYKLYVNLLEIGYPYWNIFKIDMRKLSPDRAGIKDYVPSVQPWGSGAFTFLYHEDLLEKAGVTRADILKLRSWSDIDAAPGEAEGLRGCSPGRSEVRVRLGVGRLGAGEDHARGVGRVHGRIGEGHPGPLPGQDQVDGPRPESFRAAPGEGEGLVPEGLLPAEVLDPAVGGGLRGILHRKERHADVARTLAVVEGRGGKPERECLGIPTPRSPTA